MKRINIYLSESQIDFLKDLNELSISEHVRRSLDLYINKLKPDKSSASLSERKGNHE